MLTKVLKDRPGVVPIEQIQIWFERIVTESSLIHELPLTFDMKLRRYESDDTNAVFLGFGFGVRHAQRLARAGTPIE